jgi:hypothetical protein
LYVISSQNLSAKIYTCHKWLVITFLKIRTNLWFLRNTEES